MSFSVGIVGLPNVGKSTLFKALTKKQVDIADYPFTTIDPNIGVVAVPDERLDKIAEVIKPAKKTPTVIEFVDIAGLVKNAHKGEGLGNQFLAQIRNCDAIVEVVKIFGEKANPEDDIETIKTELEMKDLDSKEKENLLAKKPIIYLLNTDDKTKFSPPKFDYLAMNLKDEAEISELSAEEAKELGLESKFDQLILACYNILSLITFYTITGGQETRAWTLQKGQNCPQAGGKVHSDFEEKFIKAEVVNWQKLIEAGSWVKAREKGWIQTAGKDYIVRDGDVIEFKI
jgi:small GTP-binding protein